MANLDGSRSHGAAVGRPGRRHASATTPARFSDVYRLLLHAARAEGIGTDRLPDFLGLENGGDWPCWARRSSTFGARGKPAGPSNAMPAKRLVPAGDRADPAGCGQGRPARVRAACTGQLRQPLCLLRPKSAAFGGAKRMLLAGHIKPWKDSTPSERLDPRNGLAACPPHDVAFDTGLLTVNGGLRIHVARSLAEATRTDPLARQYYGRPPLQEHCCYRSAPRRLLANTSTGIGRRSLYPDRALIL